MANNHPGPDWVTGRKIAVSQSHTKGQLSVFISCSKDQNCQNRTGETYKQLISPLPQCLALLLAVSCLASPSLLAEKAKQQVSKIFFANGLKYYTHNYSLAGFFFSFLLILLAWQTVYLITAIHVFLKKWALSYLADGISPRWGKLSRLRKPSAGLWSKAVGGRVLPLSVEQDRTERMKV